MEGRLLDRSFEELLADASDDDTSDKCCDSCDNQLDETFCCAVHELPPGRAGSLGGNVRPEELVAGERADRTETVTDGSEYSSESIAAWTTG